MCAGGRVVLARLRLAADNCRYVWAQENPARDGQCCWVATAWFLNLGYAHLTYVAFNSSVRVDYILGKKNQSKLARLEDTRNMERKRKILAPRSNKLIKEISIRITVFNLPWLPVFFIFCFLLAWLALSCWRLAAPLILKGWPEQE